ncbi:MAG: Holliday junction resolvase RuvX [Candidatus Binataceae bacterium]
MTIAALDLGTKRIGLAVSDQGQTTALPLCTIERRVLRWDLQQVAERLADREVALVVVGLPLNMDGSEGPAARQARAFAARLETELGISVELFDERLTSVEAEERLAQADAGKRRRKQAADAIAAAIILEGWLAVNRAGK